MKRWSFVVLFLCGCQPSLDSAVGSVTSALVLAVRAEPPEARPGQSVSLSALVASPDGTLDADVAWAFCTHPRSVAENNSVAPECFRDSEEWLVGLGAVAGDTFLNASVPSEACALFGSEPPPAEPGHPPTRAADADATGGYYQPVRASVAEEDATTIGHVRVRCALPFAPVDISRDYNTRYTNNENPRLESFDVADATDVVAPGDIVDLQATWSGNSAESFPYYNPETRRLEDVAETLRVSWYASTGTVLTERDVAAAEQSRASGQWQAPTQPGTAFLWAVLRDSRGGVAWRELTITVE